MKRHTCKRFFYSSSGYFRGPLWDRWPLVTLYLPTLVAIHAAHKRLCVEWMFMLPVPGAITSLMHALTQ